LKLGIIWIWEVNFTIWPLFLQGKPPDTHKIGWWMNLRAGLYVFGRDKKNSLSFVGIENQIVQLVAGIFLTTLPRLSSACMLLLM
jgi:hypothetical protein